MTAAPAPDLTALREQIGEALEPVTVAATPAEVIARPMDGLNQAALVPSPAAFDALADAVMPVVAAALAEKDAEIGQLRRQVNGYRGMKDTYLRERNSAHAELLKFEDLVERLCDDREAGQAMVKAALTEQRERAEQAEASLATAHALLARTTHDDRPTVYWDGRWTPIIWPDELATALAIGTGD